MSKKKKRSTPAAAPAEPAKAEHTQPEEPAVSSTARWMGALCYLSILILIPACTKWRQDEFVRFHLNQGLMVLMLATICAALGFVPVLEQVALSLTLLGRTPAVHWPAGRAVPPILIRIFYLYFPDCIIQKSFSHICIFVLYYSNCIIL